MEEEEQEQFRASLEEQARLLNHLKDMLQNIKELVDFLEKASEQQPTCMSSSCCRNFDGTI
jgi:hypothetical protein